MNHLIAFLIGSGIGTVIGLAAISCIHRSVWGHWRFWQFERAPNHHDEKKVK